MQRKEIEMIIAESSSQIEGSLSVYACKNSSARRLKPEKGDGLRSEFAIDRDRILYSGAYRRYQGKTQVFSFTNMIDEEMTNRSLHTTYVSQIARTIAKILRLNTELTEAIALGHDLGHTPFGHEGERALNKCCLEHGIGEFKHNIASLRVVDHITKRGEGLNLTFQVRDGIISHDGEAHNRSLIPYRSKTEADIGKYVEDSLPPNTIRQKNSDAPAQTQPGSLQAENKGHPEWMPATLEGCVVRMSDTIAYIGQDIEDAIRHNILTRDELPAGCTAYFGNTNSDIINKLIRDVISNSYEQDSISLSRETSDMLLLLKEFNYAKIYKHPKIKEHTATISRAMQILFAKYLDDIASNNSESKMFKHFLNHKSNRYLDNFSQAEKVRDFISTMTDRYFNQEVRDYLLPWKD